jgi:hypothetical protein
VHAPLVAPSPRRLATAPLRAVATAAAAAIPDPQPAVTPSPSSDQVDLRNEVLEAAWREQTLDAQWSDEVSAHIEAAFADLELAATARAATCGTTLCRVELEFEGPEDAARLQELADDGRPKEIFVQPGREGVGLSVVAYLFRVEPETGAGPGPGL